MIKSLLFSFALLFSVVAVAQVNIKDSSITIPMINVHTGFHIPGGDLEERFGNNGTVGAEFQLKLKSQWLFGANYSFIFGNDIKNQDNYFHRIKTSDGYVLDGNGQFAELFLYQRGFNASLQFGRQFDIWNINPNSGPYFLVSPGYFQHYVRIENPDNVTPQIAGDYLKGYDRLTAGFSLTEFVGYRFFSNNRLFNFYLGVEFTQAWTQSQRSFNYDDMARDTKERLDLMYGIKFGWMIPLYGRVPNDYYYY